MKYSIILIFIAFMKDANTQSLFFRFNDGSSKIFLVNDIRKITFNGNLLNLEKRDGLKESWNVFEIANNNYSIITNIINPIYNKYNIKLFPNPVKNILNISYQLKEMDIISMEIADVNGRVLKKWKMNKQNPGRYNYTWVLNENNNLNLWTGIYFLRFSTSKKSESIMFLVE